MGKCLIVLFAIINEQRYSHHTYLYKGGIITGNIGDAHGRKKALVFSLFCMTVPTVAMGFLPTYKQVGGWSTTLLVICRLLQGFSVGGQLPSSLVYTLEQKPKKYWVRVLLCVV